MATRNREICDSRYSNLQNVNECAALFLPFFLSFFRHLQSHRSMPFSLMHPTYLRLGAFEWAAIVLGHYRFVHVVHYVCLQSLMPRDWFNLIFALYEDLSDMHLG